MRYVNLSDTSRAGILDRLVELRRRIPASSWMYQVFMGMVAWILVSVLVVPRNSNRATDETAVPIEMVSGIDFTNS